MRVEVKQGLGIMLDTWTDKIDKSQFERRFTKNSQRPQTPETWDNVFDKEDKVQREKQGNFNETQGKWGRRHSNRIWRCKARSVCLPELVDDKVMELCTKSLWWSKCTQHFIPPFFISRTKPAVGQDRCWWAETCSNLNPEEEMQLNLEIRVFNLKKRVW